MREKIALSNQLTLPFNFFNEMTMFLWHSIHKWKKKTKINSFTDLGILRYVTTSKKKIKDKSFIMIVYLVKYNSIQLVYVAMLEGYRCNLNTDVLNTSNGRLRHDKKNLSIFDGLSCRLDAFFRKFWLRFPSCH